MNRNRTPKPKQRKYSSEVVNRLFALTAGRCEFRGCNKFTLQHEVTSEVGNFSQKAHIIAFSDRGPRAAIRDTSLSINSIENIMLLCQSCHKLIDSKPSEYSVELLRQFKKEHEERVQLVTEFGVERKTKPLVFIANIAKDGVSVSEDDVFVSLFPNRYPSGRTVALDLSSLSDNASWYDVGARDSMAGFIENFYREPPSGIRPTHVSVYALGPIPLLVQLGASLTNKIETDFYQKHRMRGTWKWEDGSGTVEYSVQKIREGTNPVKVAMILSLSGKIHLTSVDIGDEYSVYEIEVKDGDNGPNFLFLRTHADLISFRKTYAQLIAKIVSEHAGVTEIHLYPAIPAPIAVTCGFDLLPKVHPNLVVYDADKTKGGFINTLTVARQENI